MARKILHLNMILKQKINKDLIDFVNNPKAKTFSLTGSPLQDHTSYPDKDYRIMIVNILSALFPYRKDVTHINLTNVRFNAIETGCIIKSINPFKKV